MSVVRSFDRRSHLNHRLLRGVSGVALTLIASIALPSVANAQEIIGATGDATVLSGGNAITSGTVGGQFGVIDTEGGGNNPASITLTENETIRIFDSIGSGDTSTVGFVDIHEGVTGTIVFAEDRSGNAAAGATLTITNDLDGDGINRGGTLNLLAHSGGGLSLGTFNVNGSTLLTGLSLTGADGVDGGDAGRALSVSFGSGNDTFNVTGITVQAGNADGSSHGGQVNVSINADSGAGVVTFGSDGLIITGGNADTTGDGRSAVVDIFDSAAIEGAITLRGGDAGTGNVSPGGDTEVDFADTSAGSTVTINGLVSLITGTDGPAVSSEGGNAVAYFRSETIHANGGILLSDQEGDAVARTIFRPLRDQTINANISAADDGDGVVTLEGGQASRTLNITFNGAIGSSSARVGILDLVEGEVVNVVGDVFVNELEIDPDVVRGQFDGNVDATRIEMDNTRDGDVTADFNGMLTIGANDFLLDAGILGGTHRALAFIAGDVAGPGAILLDDRGGGGIGERDAEVDFDGTTAQSVANVIRGVADSQGELFISNAAGVTFNGRLGTETTQGDRGLRLLTINANSMATFNSDVATQNFAVGGDGSTLTFNSALAGPQVLVGDTNAGTLTLDDGTINLGANVGDGDTVFDLNGAAASLPTMTAAAGGLALNLSANFTNGAIALIDSNGRDYSTGQGATDALDFNVTDTALTDFTVQARGGATDILEVTAAARTTIQIATILGITEEEAEALQGAAQSTDETLIDLLTDALSDSLTDPTDAAAAARMVGLRNEIVGSGSSVGREMASQQEGVTGDRLSGFRSSDPRFVTAFASTQSGIAAGDMDGSYTPVGPRYANSIWGQVYGGVAEADGSTTLAGFDAGFGGAMIGIDGAVREDLVIGAFAGYGFADVDGDGAGNAQLETSAYQAGLYAGYTGASFTVDAFAAYAMTENDTVRTTLGNNRVTGVFDASQVTLGLSAGAPIAVSETAFLTPNASLTWNHYSSDGYTEVGVGANTVSASTNSTLTGTIGARWHAVYEMANGRTVIPEISAGLLYDLMDDDSRASATFVGGNTAYTVSGTEIADLGAVIGAGLTMRGDVWSFGIAYDADIRSDFMSHTGRAEVRMMF